MQVTQDTIAALKTDSRSEELHFQTAVMPAITKAGDAYGNGVCNDVKQILPWSHDHILN